MWEVAIHERSKKGGEGIAKIACIAGTGEGKNSEDASAHKGKKLHSQENLLTPPTQAIVKSKL